MTDSTLLEAWTVSHLDYPGGGPQRAQLAYLARYAILAPSSHNTQPWLFDIGDEHLELYADRSRFLEAIDPQGRQLVMSCGAALLNLRVAARRFGREDLVDIVADASQGTLRPGAPERIARMRLGRAIAPATEDMLLFDTIPLRHTNRQPFAARPVSYRIADTLAEAAAREGAWLVRLEPEGKRRAAALIAAADEVQYHDKRFRHELASWLSPGRSRRRDGVPTEARSEGLLRSEPMFVRAFDMGKAVAAWERELAAGAPLLVVLGTDRDGMDDWLRAGQALQRLLLIARTYGITASFLNQAVEVADIRPRLASLTGREGGSPQIVLRMGYGQDSRPTPRRKLEDMILPD